MNQSTASSLRKLAVGGALAFGAAALSSSTACTVTISCPAGEFDCDGICCLDGDSCVNGTCVTSCTPDLQSCAFDSDCCTGICAGDGLCGCVLTNETGCAVDSDCCSTADLCINGICQ